MAEHSHHLVPRRVPGTTDAQVLACADCGKTEKQLREEALEKPATETEQQLRDEFARAVRIDGLTIHSVTFVHKSHALIDKPMTCRVCGCTDDNACLPPGGPCHWVGNDLCSACLPERTC